MLSFLITFEEKKIRLKFSKAHLMSRPRWIREGHISKLNSAIKRGGLKRTTDQIRLSFHQILNAFNKRKLQEEFKVSLKY